MDDTVSVGPGGGAQGRLLWALVVLGVALRLLIALYQPLGVDEAYATAVAREFSWSFFDHPPLGFWAPVVAAKLSGSAAPLILRLPDLLFGGASAWLIYLIGRELGGGRAGLWSLGLFAFSPAFVLAGVFILPDGPLEMSSAFAVYWLVRLVKSGDRATIGQWLWVGLGAGVALASKYQAGLIPVSVLVFALVTPVGRRWLVTPGPYVASAIALIGLAPVIWWNAQNGWVSFRFQGGRTGDGLQLANFAVMLLGQALYLLPPVMVLGLLGLGAALRDRRPERLLVALVALAPIAMFNLVYLFSASSLPHWTMPGWQFTMPLAGAWLAAARAPLRHRAGVWVSGFAVPAHALILLAVLHMNTGIVTRFFYDSPPAWDRTVNAFDYRPLRPALQARGDLDGVSMIAASGWVNAGAMSWAFSGELPVRVLGDVAHHFAYMSGARIGGQALLLEPETLARATGRLAQLLQMARTFDANAQALAPVILQRGGIPYVAVNVVRLRLPAATP